MRLFNNNSLVIFLSLVALGAAQHEPEDSEAGWSGRCPTGPILTIEIERHQRMGAKMWKYAELWILAQDLERQAFVPSFILDTLDTVFANLSIPALEEIAHCDIKFEPYHDAFTGAQLKEFDNGQNILLGPHGLLFPEFMQNLPELKQLFQFRPEVLEEVQRTLRGVGGGKTVGVHVRRTDYAQFLPTHRHFPSLVDAQYFKDSMQWFRDRYPDANVTFLVVSDDIDWCQKNLNWSDVTFVSKSPGHDMALLATCDHRIIDYGSFGFWGSILAKDGHTLALNISDPELKNIRNASHLINWHFVDREKYYAKTN